MKRPPIGCSEVSATEGDWAFIALAITGNAPLAQSNVTVAVGGSSCLCYLHAGAGQSAWQLGEFSKTGLNVNIVNFKGGQTRLRR
jgi:NitT/TauT family transport system substrate-binding protein